jgi:hypothetical protein
MNRQSLNRISRYCWLFLVLAGWPFIANAQVAVAEIEEFEELPTASAEELETLIGPIALYPDDLLAIVLPASTFPLQIVAAGRFLENLEADASLKPDEDWDDSVVALLNYPEVIELLNEDLDWTWRLGEAVVAQQEDVISAIELFRDRAYAAGNLKSDDYQLVAHEGSSIQITPVEEDVIYVPYYEPEQVVVYQPRPVYYYYPRSYPVYYYPYPAYHSFHNSFWGVTTAYAIGWHSHHLSVFHHSFYGHPYYGHSYWDRYWYRRPDIHVYNNVHVRNSVNVSYNRYRDGDRWQPNVRRTVRASDQRVTRTRYYPSSDSSSRLSNNSSSFASSSTSSRAVRDNDTYRQTERELRSEERTEIQFRERAATPRTNTSNRSSVRPSSASEPQQQQPQVRESRQRETQVRQSQPKQPQVRESRQRETQVRQSQPGQARARESQPRQLQARQPQTQVKETKSRQPQERQSHSRQSQPKAAPQRASQVKQGQSRSSERVARNSSERSQKRDH